MKRRAPKALCCTLSLLLLWEYPVCSFGQGLLTASRPPSGQAQAEAAPEVAGPAWPDGANTRAVAQEEAPSVLPQVSTVPAALDAGRTAYGDLEYERGVELLQRSLAQETLSPEQKRDAYLYLGLCLASLGREEEAQLAFLQLLDLSPDFRLDNRVYSPTIVTVFESALEERSRRLRVGDNLPPVLQVRDIDQPVLYRREVTVAARVADDQGVAAVQLFYRRSGESGYSFLPMTAQGTGVYAAAIPGFMADHEGLEYYVLALDRAGNASLTGNAALPLQLKVQPGSETKPWYKKWWVWAIIGAAAGAGAAIGVTLSNGGGGDGGGTATLQVGLQ